jgi:hypothetical protein
MLLVPVAVLNYLDRQMLATMKASMVGDIPSIANKADWGLILGCFKWSYAILSPFGRIHRGPFQPALGDLHQPFRMVGGDLVDGTRDILSRADVGARGDGVE